MIAIHQPLRATDGRRVRVFRTRRAGYTLLEIVIVVTLISGVAAMTLPSVDGLFLNARTDAAGDMIRARMADARSMAMEHGTAYRFGFVPGTGKFQIAADDSPMWDSVQSSGHVEADDLIRGELPEDVVFGTKPGSVSAGGGGSWQLGGVFLPTGEAHGPMNPDGTTADDVTFYFGTPGYAPQGVILHGLTGTVRVFDPTTDGDQP